MNTAATRPFDRDTALRIARAFLPKHPLGNRWDYYYTLAKLRSDPLYPGVLQALRGSDAPVLDLGCGLGLLAHALRADGQHMAYRGVDNDAAKITRANKVAEKNALVDTRFDVVDLAGGPPAHQGSVAILDVLQYLDAQGQRSLVAQVSAMLDVALSGYGVATPVAANSPVAPMLAAFANAQVAAMARGVNGQGKFAERPTTADEMLLIIGDATAAWVARNIGGLGAVLDVTPVALSTPVVRIGSFTRQDGYSSDGHEYTV